MDPHKTQCLSNSTLVKHSVLEAPMSKTHSKIITFAFQDDPMTHLPPFLPFLLPSSLSLPLFLPLPLPLPLPLFPKQLLAVRGPGGKNRYP